jgi:hypothetical protein
MFTGFLNQWQQKIRWKLIKDFSMDWGWISMDK